MAKILTKAGVTTGNTVEAFHVTQSIDAFTGIDAYDISLSGSFNMTGSINGEPGVTNPLTASYAITASYADNALSAINTPNAVITASNTGNDDTIEFLKGGGGAFSVTVNNVVSSSYALTASYALNGGGGSDTNFANTDLTFDADRNHDSNGFDFVVSADNGGFNSAYIGYNFSSFMGGITTSSYIGVENTYVETRDQLGVQSIILRVDNTGSIDITGGVSGGVNINSNSLFVSTVTDNVSIGKNTSNAKLDVNGNAIITGSLTVTDTLDANSGSFNYIEADEIIRHTGDNGTGLQFGSDQVTILGNTYINAQFSTTVNTIGNSFLEQPLTIHGDSTFEDRIITTTTDNAITAAGTFNPTGGNRSYVTLNGTIAVTLDDGVQGQILHIYCRDITSAGTTTITPTNKAGFTSIAFDAIGETATLMFADGGGGQWYLISSFGATVS
jgi:hypothetical protein